MLGCAGLLMEDCLVSIILLRAKENLQQVCAMGTVALSCTWHLHREDTAHEAQPSDPVTQPTRHDQTRPGMSRM